MGLPDGLDYLTCLKYLSIGGFCEEFDAFPSLSSIQHASLETLNSLPEDTQRFTALTELWIHTFDQMEALPECLGYLSSLRNLYLLECMKLMYLPIAEMMQHLTELNIYKCPKIEGQVCEGKQLRVVQNCPYSKSSVQLGMGSLVLNIHIGPRQTRVVSFLILN